MSANRGYDANLLAAAPVATRAELQEGYNVDILNPPTARPLAPSSLDHSGYPKENYILPPPPPVPFWKTKKGAIVIVGVTIVVLIAIIVGAAVGVTHKNHGSNTIANSSATTIGTEGSGGGSVGPISSSSSNHSKTSLFPNAPSVLSSPSPTFSTPPISGVPTSPISPLIPATTIFPTQQSPGTPPNLSGISVSM